MSKLFAIKKDTQNRVSRMDCLSIAALAPVLAPASVLTPISPTQALAPVSPTHVWSHNEIKDQTHQPQ